MKIRTVILTAALLFAACDSDRLVIGTDLVVLEGANLIDGTSRPPVVGATIILDGDRIRAVGRSGQLQFNSSSAVIVDARGKWIVPGFIDVHSHMPPAFQEQFLFITQLL